MGFYRTTSATPEMILDPPRDHPWVIPGGGDIWPGLYNEPVTHTRWFDRQRDEQEYLLVCSLLDLKIPVLGICRGHQFLVAATGGKLYQDIQAEYQSPVSHTHGPVTVVVPEFAEVFKPFVVGGVSLAANTIHHQAAKTLGKGWKPAAYAPDGIIEAMWNQDFPQVVSVQWHPEMMPGQYEHIHNYLHTFCRR